MWFLTNLIYVRGEEKKQEGEQEERGEEPDDTNRVTWRRIPDNDVNTDGFAPKRGEEFSCARKPRYRQVRGGTLTFVRRLKPSRQSQRLTYPFQRACRPLSAIGATVVHPLLAVVYAFVVIPLLDVWTGDDDSAAPTGKLTPQMKKEFRSLIKLYPLVHFTMLLTVLNMVTSATGSRAYSGLDILGLTLSLGVGSSMSFTVAHELLHSTDEFERNLSAILLLPNFYMHWGRAHLQHHAHVGTPKDPTTSRRGEMVYAFWMRSIAGNYLNAFRAEWKRPNGGNVFTWIVAPLALLLTTYVVYGRLGAAVLVGQAAISVLMLETGTLSSSWGNLMRPTTGGC